MLLADYYFGSAGDFVDCFKYVLVFRDTGAGISLAIAPLQRITIGANYNRAYILDNPHQNRATTINFGS
jgi:hypothetical protein